MSSANNTNTDTAAPPPPPQPSYADRRNAKSLEEHRKFGLAPLAKDAMTGEDISPHVPTHMATTPWYLKKQLEMTMAANGVGEEGGGAALTLAHHRVEQKDHTALKEVETTVTKASSSSSSSSNKGIGGGSLFASLSSGVAATSTQRFMAGACKNCGSMSHKEQACLRPKRAAGASVTKRIEGETYLIQDEQRVIGGKKGGGEDSSSSYHQGGVGSTTVTQGSLTSQLQQQGSSSNSSNISSVKRDYEQKRSMAFSSNVRLSFEAAQEQHREGKKLQKALAAAAAESSKDSKATLLGSDVDLATGAPGTLASALASNNNNVKGGASRFAAKTGADGSSAVGGVGAAGALPKYLENLDNDTTFFDPRSRSMRGDPNALKRLAAAAALDIIVRDDEVLPDEEDDSIEDLAAKASSNIFQGDNANTHTEGYMEYLDQQYSFVTGKTNKFVDMSADPKLRRSSAALSSSGASAGASRDEKVDHPTSLSEGTNNISNNNDTIVAAAASQKGSLVASALYSEVSSPPPSMLGVVSGNRRPREGDDNDVDYYNTREGRQE